MTTAPPLEIMSRRLRGIACELELLAMFGRVPARCDELPIDRRRIAMRLLHLAAAVMVLDADAAAIGGPAARHSRKAVTLVRFSLEGLLGPLAWCDRTPDDLPPAGPCPSVLFLIGSPWPRTLPRDFHRLVATHHALAAAELAAWPSRLGPALLDAAAELQLMAFKPSAAVDDGILARCRRARMSAHRTEIFMAVSRQPKQRLRELARGVERWKAGVNADTACRTFKAIRDHLAAAGENTLAIALNISRSGNDDPIVTFYLPPDWASGAASPSLVACRAAG